MQTGTVTLPNAGTVETSKYFLTVTSATASAATIDTMDVGWVDEFVSKTIVLNHYANVAATAQIIVTGTINFGIETTLENPIQKVGGDAPFAFNDQSDLAWLDDANFTGKTASLAAKLALTGVRAMRLVCNSYTDTAELQMYVTQPR